MNRWLLLGGGAVLLALGLLWFRGRTSGQPMVQTVGAQPGLAPDALSADQLGLATGDLQQQLSDLVTQFSTGFAALQRPTAGTAPANVAAPGCAGVDPWAGAVGGVRCGGLAPVHPVFQGTDNAMRIGV